MRKDQRDATVAEMADVASPAPRPLDKSRKYAVRSAVQKFIRRGRPVEAAQATADLIPLGGAWWTAYGLQVSGLEDCLGDGVEAAGLILALRDVRLREMVPPERLLPFLAAKLARLRKARVASDLGFVGAAVLGCYRAMARPIDMPDDVEAVARLDPKGLEGLQEHFRLAVDLIGQCETTLIDEAPAADELIDGLPACCFDAHCGEGKRSLAYASRSVPAIREFLDRHPVERKIETLALCLWDVESGACRGRVDAPLIREIRAKAKAEWMKGAGLTAEQFGELEGLLAANLDGLNRARKRIVQAMAEEATAKAANESQCSPYTTPTPHAELPLWDAHKSPQEPKKENSTSSRSR